MGRAVNGLKNTEKQKLNNSGFSLVEVLVAVIILAIVAVPLIRSFATAAVTNSKAQILMMATDCAENLMEISKHTSVEDMAVTYDTGDNEVNYNATTGVYTLTLKDADTLPSKLPNGHYVEMSYDPTKFSNNNAYNISDVRSMSLLDTAVYEMSPLYDSKVYDTFYEWNQNAVSTSPTGAYNTAPGGADYFKDKLTRHIDVTIDKLDTQGTDADGNTFDHVVVNIDIRYDFASTASYRNYLTDEQSVYEERTREIFNNTSTDEPLRGIYIFFDPCYEATAMGNADEITIHNPDNVEVDLFLAAQNNATNVAAQTAYLDAMMGAVVTIEETRSNTTDPAAITLFTNLSSEAPYSAKLVEADPTKEGEVKCQLTLKDSTNTVGDVTGNTALELMDGRNLDGKALRSGNVKKRIYKVTTKVINSDGTIIVELDGTKLE